MPRTIKRTEIEINASPEKVWEVLTDLGSYSEWNPMIRSAAGKVEPGRTLTLHFNPPGTKGYVFRPVVLVADTARHFRWQGKPGVPCVLESEHYFILEKAGPGCTRLRHDMEFTGLLVPFIRKIIHRNTVGPFMLMNRALKERVERDTPHGRGQR